MSKRYSKYEQADLERMGWEFVEAATDADAWEPKDKEQPQVSLIVHEDEGDKGRYECGFRGLTVWGRHPVSPDMAMDLLSIWGNA